MTEPQQIDNTTQKINVSVRICSEFLDVFSKKVDMQLDPSETVGKAIQIALNEIIKRYEKDYNGKLILDYAKRGLICGDSFLRFYYDYRKISECEKCGDKVILESDLYNNLFIEHEESNTVIVIPDNSQPHQIIEMLKDLCGINLLK